MRDMYTRTAERLPLFYDFDSTVVEQVAEAAADQAQCETYGDFFESVGITDTFTYEHDGNDFEMVDIRPDEHDSRKAMLIRLGMGNPLDNNSLYQIGSIAKLFPNTRIIASGNLSGGNYPGGVVSKSDNHDIRNGNFASLSAPSRAYGEETGATVFDEVGFSLGAHVAMAGVENHDINGLTVIEAVMGKRGLARLGVDFILTSFMLDEYVKRSNLPTFIEARKDSIQQGPFVAGLAKPTNRATARGLAKLSGTTADVMTDIVENNKVNWLTNIWAGASELGDDEASAELVASLQELMSDCDVRGIRVDDEKHLMVNDLQLFGALVLQSYLRR